MMLCSSHVLPASTEHNRTSFGRKFPFSFVPGDLKGIEPNSDSIVPSNNQISFDLVVIISNARLLYVMLTLDRL